MRTCKNCKIKFQPTYSKVQLTCSYQCALDYNKAQAEKKEQKEWNKRKKEIKEKLKSRSQHLKELQIIFNKFIRIRDERKGCISCKRPLTGKYDAGHYYPVGGVPNLRFNEDNVQGQCVYCNQHLHGNLIEYRKNLIERIGKAKVDELDKLKNQELKLTIPEIIELKEIYKKKIKVFSFRKP